MLTTGMYLVAVQIELRMDCFELAVEAAHKRNTISMISLRHLINVVDSLIPVQRPS